MIANKVGIETLIRSAWESDEEMLQKAYIESEKEPEEISRQNFLEVDESIKKLKSLYEYEKDYLKYNQKSSEVIDNLQNILGNKEKEASASLKSPASWKVPASLKTEKETDAKSGEENTHSSEGIKESKKGGLEDVLDAGINRS